jgi:hypothetical protein
VAEPLPLVAPAEVDAPLEPVELPPVELPVELPPVPVLPLLAEALIAPAVVPLLETTVPPVLPPLVLPEVVAPAEVEVLSSVCELHEAPRPTSAASNPKADAFLKLLLTSRIGLGGIEANLCIPRLPRQAIGC